MCHILGVSSNGCVEGYFWCHKNGFLYVAKVQTFQCPLGIISIFLGHLHRSYLPDKDLRQVEVYEYVKDYQKINQIHGLNYLNHFIFNRVNLPGSLNY